MKLTIEKKNGYKIYNLLFSNLTELYDYLKSKPKVNKEVFTSQASGDNDKAFHGEPLNKSIEYIISGYNEGFENFLIDCERLSEANYDVSDSRKLKRGLYGGIPLPPLVASGVPDCMLRYERDSSAEVRNVFFTLAYPHYTRAEQIVNRGLATLYIINSLEKKGDLINFKACETSRCRDEIINIEIILKRPGDMFLDIQKCYFPIVGKEFLRRILFRVLESMPVKNNWVDGYGAQLDPEELRNIMGVPEYDIIVPSPGSIGIGGDNIYDDTIRTIKNLNLEKEFNTEKIKKIGLKYR